MERRALDNALLAGAIETQTPIRYRSEEQRFAHEMLVEPQRCYYVSVASRIGARINVRYAFGQAFLDGRPVSDGGAMGEFWSHPGGQGVARFLCRSRGDREAHPRGPIWSIRYRWWTLPS